MDDIHICESGPTENRTAQGRQYKFRRPRLVMPRHLQRTDTTVIALICAPIAFRITVQDLLPFTWLGQTDAVGLPRHRRQIQHHQHAPVELRCLPHKARHTIEVIFAIHPKEPRLGIIPRPQCRLVAVMVIQITHPLLKTGGQIAWLETIPVNFLILIPLRALPKLPPIKSSGLPVNNH